MATSNTALAARLARGEVTAFAELYDACADQLHHFLAVSLGSRDSASDVLQTTFLRAVSHRRCFAGVENPIAYLFQVARNEAVRAVRREKRQKMMTLADKEIHRASADCALPDDMEIAAAALAKLASDDRELIELKIYAGLTFLEIGQVIGQPTATVATRYRRALQSLRPWLTKQFR